MCLAYNAWRNEIQERTAAINEQKQIELLVSDYHVSAVAKIKKHSGRKWKHGGCEMD